MTQDEKYVELIWHQKYDKIDKGVKVPSEKPNLPFQVVESINKPRIKGGVQSFLFPEDEYPDNYPSDWKNLLIWGDNKLVMSSLLKQGWAGLEKSISSTSTHRSLQVRTSPYEQGLATNG